MPTNVFGGWVTVVKIVLVVWKRFFAVLAFAAQIFNSFDFLLYEGVNLVGHHTRFAREILAVGIVMKIR